MGKAARGPGDSRVTRRPPPGWNELLIASFSHRSIAVKDGILLATGLHVHRNSAHSAGVGAIFDRWASVLSAGAADAGAETRRDRRDPRGPPSGSFPKPCVGRALP